MTNASTLGFPTSRPTYDAPETMHMGGNKTRLNTIRHLYITAILCANDREGIQITPSCLFFGSNFSYHPVLRPSTEKSCETKWSLLFNTINGITTESKDEKQHLTRTASHAHVPHLYAFLNSWVPRPSIHPLLLQLQETPWDGKRQAPGKKRKTMPSIKPLQHDANTTER